MQLSNDLLMQVAHPTPNEVRLRGLLRNCCLRFTLQPYILRCGFTWKRTRACCVKDFNVGYKFPVENVHRYPTHAGMRACRLPAAKRNCFKALKESIAEQIWLQLPVSKIVFSTSMAGTSFMLGSFNMKVSR